MLKLKLFETTRPISRLSTRLAWVELHSNRLTMSCCNELLMIPNRPATTQVKRLENTFHAPLPGSPPLSSRSHLRFCIWRSKNHKADRDERNRSRSRDQSDIDLEI